MIPPNTVDREGNPRKLKDIEADMIDYVMQRCKNDVREAAKMLGIGKSTLYAKLSMQIPKEWRNQ